MTQTSTDRPRTVIEADHLSGPAQGQWTYDDYAELPEDGQRYEIIEGVLYVAPAAGEPHQASNIRFGSYLFTHVELAGLGRVYMPPFDIELSPKNVVQPDVTVVLNHNLSVITPSRIIGSPDLVVEIASPSTVRYNRNKKLAAYERAGVPEYWIANTVDRTVEILQLEQGAYRSVGVFQGQQTLPSQIVPNLPIRVVQFFF